jgi:hypothetical protein
MKAWLLCALLPIAAEAQLVIHAVNGNTETVVGSSYDFGQVALNTASNQQFRIYNMSNMSPVAVTVVLSGAGFTFTSPLLPYTIPPNSSVTQSLNITVSFTPTSTASFSANLQINGLSVILLGSGVTAPTLTSVSACSSTVPFNFGSIPVNNSATCTFALQNLNPQAIAVSSVIINGLGFTGPYGITAPLTLQPQEAVSFAVNFTPPGALSYSGTIAIGTQSYAISGTGQTALLPVPTLQLNASSYASGQQAVLTMTLPSPAPIAATGYVNLAFTPSTAAVKDDSEIVFLANGARSIPFSVGAGKTTALLSGQSSAAFQTGTTEGTITFTIATATALTGNPPVQAITIGGTPVIIDSSSASNQRTGFLDITIAGADNTYSAGMMTFSFFDASGNAIASPVSADFTSTFKSYYSGASAGSAFQVVVSFPVVGSVANIGSVKVTLTNAAGPANTGSLTFQ